MNPAQIPFDFTPPPPAPVWVPQPVAVVREPELPSIADMLTGKVVAGMFNQSTFYTLAPFAVAAVAVLWAIEPLAAVAVALPAGMAALAELGAANHPRRWWSANRAKAAVFIVLWVMSWWLSVKSCDDPRAWISDDLGFRFTPHMMGWCALLVGWVAFGAARHMLAKKI